MVARWDSTVEPAHGIDPGRLEHVPMEVLRQSRRAVIPTTTSSSSARWREAPTTWSAETEDLLVLGEVQRIPIVDVPTFWQKLLEQRERA
jgi:hypothetical protein